MLINHGEDAVADSEPNEGGGIDFDAQRDCAVGAEVLDILTEDTVVYKPTMEAFRRAQPERGSEQQQRGCR